MLWLKVWSISINMSKLSIKFFLQRVAAKGYCIKGDTPSDGNCCFWALSVQLDNDSWGKHNTYRTQEDCYKLSPGDARGMFDFTVYFIITCIYLYALEPHWRHCVESLKSIISV